MRRKGRIVTTVAVCAATVALTAVAIALAPDTSSESNTAAVPTSTTTATASSESFAFTPNVDVPSNGHPIEATITEEPKNADMAPSDIPADSPHPDRLYMNLVRFVDAYAWYGTEGLTDPAMPKCDPNDTTQTEEGSALQNFLKNLEAARLQRLENLQHPADPSVVGVVITDDALAALKSSISQPLGFNPACGLYNTQGNLQGAAAMDRKNVTVQNNDPKQLFVRLPVVTTYNSVSSEGQHVSTFDPNAEGMVITAWQYDDQSGQWELTYFAP